VEAGAVSEWYFSRYMNIKNNKGPKIRGEGEDELSTSPICSSLWRFVRFNMGTVIFASCVMALIETIRVFVEYVQQHSGNDNCFTSCLSKMLCCCMWFVDHINRHGLIMTAMQGYAFCPSVRMSSQLIWNNLFRVAVVHAVGGLAVKVGMLAVVGVTAALSAITLQQMQSEVEYIAIPIVGVVVISFFVSSLFLGVFDNAVDVIFLCFLVDEKLYDNANFAPEDLREFLANHMEESRSIATKKLGRSKDAGDNHETSSSVTPTWRSQDL